MSIPFENPEHGRNYFTKQGLIDLFGNCGLEANIEIFKLSKRGKAIEQIYSTARKLLGKPLKEVGEVYDLVSWLPMEQNPGKMYPLYKFGLALLCKLSEGLYIEDEAGDEAIIRAWKV